MIKLLGFICGSVIISLVSIWYFTTQLTPQDQSQLTDDINTMAKTSVNVVDSIKPPQQIQQQEPQQDEPVITSTQSEPVEPVPEPAVDELAAKPLQDIAPDTFTEVAPPIEPEVTFDQIQLPTQIAAIWAPFNNEIKAQRFATYLTERSGEALHVVEKNWSYYITLNYQTEHQLNASFDNIKAIAIGAQLEKMELNHED